MRKHAKTRDRSKAVYERAQAIADQRSADRIEQREADKLAAMSVSERETHFAIKRRAQELADAAPPLTDEQRVKLRAIFARSAEAQQESREALLDEAAAQLRQERHAQPVTQRLADYARGDEA